MLVPVLKTFSEVKHWKTARGHKCVAYMCNEHYSQCEQYRCTSSLMHWVVISCPARWCRSVHIVGFQPPLFTFLFFLLLLLLSKLIVFCWLCFDFCLVFSRMYWMWMKFSVTWVPWYQSREKCWVSVVSNLHRGVYVAQVCWLSITVSVKPFTAGCFDGHKKWCGFMVYNNNKCISNALNPSVIRVRLKTHHSCSQ